MKRTIILLIMGVFASSAALAVVTTFSLTLDVQNNNNDLSVIEMNPIRFPAILINESTAIGAKCYTNYDSVASASELCRNTAAGSTHRTYGTYEVQGAASSPVTLSLSNSDTVNGLRLTPLFHQSSITATSTSRTLSSTGSVPVVIFGILELMVDQATVTSASTVLTFDITVNYG